MSISLVVCSLQKRILFVITLTHKKHCQLNLKRCKCKVPGSKLAASVAARLGQPEIRTGIADERQSLVVLPFSSLGLGADTGRRSGRCGICRKRSSGSTSSGTACRVWSLARSQQRAWVSPCGMTSAELFSRRQTTRSHRTVKRVWDRQKRRCEGGSRCRRLEASRLLAAESPRLVRSRAAMRWAMGSADSRPNNRAKW